MSPCECFEVLGPAWTSKQAGCKTEACGGLKGRSTQRQLAHAHGTPAGTLPQLREALADAVVTGRVPALPFEGLKCSQVQTGPQDKQL